MNLYELVSNLEENPELHLCRLLILLGIFAGKNGQGKIEGLTKIAKLDFLLRYPVYLERALNTQGNDGAKVDVEEFERQSVESSMTRYKYGPWDFRYRKFINLLVGKGFVTVDIQGRTIVIGLTQKGFEYSKIVSDDMDFQKLTKRAKILKANFDYTATNLMKFIYKTFPEIGSLSLGEEIQ